MTHDKLNVPVYEGDFIICAPELEGHWSVPELRIGLVTRSSLDSVDVFVYENGDAIPEFFLSDEIVKVPYFNVPDGVRRTLHASANVVK